MAFSPLRSKALHHNRSLSFPSAEKPSTSHLDNSLSTVKASEASFSSLSSIKNGVEGLKNLYTNVDDLLRLPHIHHIISQETREKSIDQVLEGYIQILDACTAARDLASNTKHNVHELLSSLRRKDGGGVSNYLASRKMEKKNILKSLKELRSSRSKHAQVASDCEGSDLVHKLKEAESVTISMLESMLSYFLGTKMQARKSGWSLVMTKMTVSKKGEHTNEFKRIDAFLQTSLEGVQVEELTTLLKEIDSSVQNLEEELEFLFRQLIRTRVFLLNILNN